MNNVAIAADRLSKVYRIGLSEQRHETLTGSLAAALKAPLSNFRKVRGLSRFDSLNDSDLIWALRNVSFKVDHGEVLGIIGRNGAGKSTLLKVLCRITEPTSGEAAIYGRVASLLEVGTGFHPDLTGRENVYINGTILGMKKREVDERFDEIVEFAEVAQFIDTPVKRYSSGMRVRLAFSVAAHLLPDILIIDEVLAVGDLQFQQKCVGKMGEAAREGRTVLFVSHNMSAVQRLCSRALLIDRGAVAFEGSTEDTIGEYQRLNQTAAPSRRSRASRSLEATDATIAHVDVLDSNGYERLTFGIGEPFTIRMQVDVSGPVQSLVAGLEISALDGTPLINLRTDGQGLTFGPYEAGESVSLSVGIPGLPLYPGSYRIEPWIGRRGGRRFDVPEGVTVTLHGIGLFKSEMMIQQGRGLVLMDCDWTAERAVTAVS